MSRQFSNGIMAVVFLGHGEPSESYPYKTNKSLLDLRWAFYCKRMPLSAFQKRSDLFFAAKASSEITFLKILPLALLGIESTKQTPPARCLYPISSVAMYPLTVSSESDWQFRTTKAFGASASLSLTPMTAASTMFG